MNAETIKLLLIEDDVVDQMAFKRAVKKQQLPYDYHISDCVKNATEMLAKESYDIVITDYNLGDGTGFDIFPLVEDTPIIFTTGAGDEKIAVQALQSGAFDYLIKDKDRIYLKALPDKIENATRQKRFELERKKAQEALRKSEEQFRVLFENSPDAIFVEDENGYVLDVNLAACKLHALAKSELQGKHVSDLVPTCLKESIKRSYLDWFNGKVSYNESASLRSDGKLVPVEIRASKILYAEQDALLLLVRDITERKQAEEKIAIANRELKAERDKLQYKLLFEDLINHISTRFINLTAKELDAEMSVVLKKIVEFTQTDRSYVFLLNSDKTKIKQVYEWNTVGVKTLKTQSEEIPVESVPQLMKKLNQQEFFYLSGTDELPKLTQKNNIFLNDLKSTIMLPLLYEKKLIGFIGFDSVFQEKKWDLDSIKLLQIVSEIIVNALQRKKADETLQSLYQSLKNEVEIAANVQRYLLPEWLIYEKQLMFSSTYTPSRKVGGDLFDVIPITEDTYIVYVGDISGHGVQAALMMTAVKSIINMIVETNEGSLKPSGMLNRLNSILCKELFRQNYMTILLCLIDLKQNQIRYFNAGHPPLIQYDLHSKQTIIQKEKGSVPIGWSNAIYYSEDEEDTILLDEDRIVILYTDGIFECENENGEQLGIEGLEHLIKQQEFTKCISLPHKFKQSLIDSHYDISSDDFTLLSFRKHPTAKPNEMQRMFRIRSQIENTGYIGKECEKFVFTHLQNKELAAKVELLVNEFLNNIIEHGLNNRKDSIVIIEITIHETIDITFWDKGMDWTMPLKSAARQTSAHIDKTRGLGMHIIYSIAEDVLLKRYDEINESIIKIKLR